MYKNIVMHAYSFNNIYFTIAWEVQCPLAQQHMRCYELVISDLQPYIQVPKCVVVCCCCVLLSKKGPWRVSFPQLELDSCLLNRFNKVSEKMHEENQNEILILQTNFAKSHFRTTELNSCQEKESMGQPTLLKDLKRIYPQKIWQESQKIHPPQIKSIHPIVDGMLFFSFQYSLGHFQHLILRSWCGTSAHPSPSKHPWSEPYEYMQSVYIVYIYICTS